MNLWYDKPAEKWTEALPIGNGHIGGMVFGQVNCERISINDDTLWSGYPKNQNPLQRQNDYNKARKLVLDEKHHEAQQLIENKLEGGWTQSYLPLGDIIIERDYPVHPKNYIRQLDLATAIASAEYALDETLFSCKAFVSAPSDVMVIEYTASTHGCLNFKIKMESLLHSSSKVEENCIILNGIAPSHVEPSYSNALKNPIVYKSDDCEKGMRFCAMADVQVDGGRIAAENDGLKVIDANSVRILISTCTSFAGYKLHPYTHGIDEVNGCRQALIRAKEINAADLLKEHIEDYSTYFNRVNFHLGKPASVSLPTDKRLEKFAKDGQDLELVALFFQYGRYLLISSSRAGTQAANLQGIWNGELRAPWSANYTLNINTEMNYWLTFSCNLAEMHEPLVNLICGIADNGRKTAQEVYGLPGFVAHHNSDIWRQSSPVGNGVENSAKYAFWNVAGGWLCEQLFTQYEYMQDVTFLKKTAYPVMKQAALFLQGLLVDVGEGYLAPCPATSPENSFIWQEKACSVAATSTLAVAITRELFTNCIKACDILGCDLEFAKELKEKLSRLLPFKIGTCGQLLEWDKEYVEAFPGHRHNSHLYPLHPSNLITPYTTPELALSCKKALEMRGDEGTGWSLAWKINLWARLLEGNHAWKLLKMQLLPIDIDETDMLSGGGTYPNLMDAHPPFQIDGNFGATSGIVEMLLQNMENGIHILPAKPDDWTIGSFENLVAKKGIIVSCNWNENTVNIKLCSKTNQNVELYVKNKSYGMVALLNGIDFYKQIES